MIFGGSDRARKRKAEKKVIKIKSKTRRTSKQAASRVNRYYCRSFFSVGQHENERKQNPLLATENHQIIIEPKNWITRESKHFSLVSPNTTRKVGQRITNQQLHQQPGYEMNVSTMTVRVESCYCYRRPPPPYRGWCHPVHKISYFSRYVRGNRFRLFIVVGKWAFHVDDDSIKFCDLIRLSAEKERERRPSRFRLSG